MPRRVAEARTGWRTAEDVSFNALEAAGMSGQRRAAMLRRRGAARKLWLAIILCALTAVAQIVGGMVTNSTALMTEALHMVSDALSYIISLVALHVGGRNPTSRHTFGFDRIETIGALVNVMIIWGATVPLVVRAVSHMTEDAPTDEEELVDGRVVFWYGLAGVLVNMLLAKCFWNDQSAHSHGNMSARAAKLHVTGDLIESFSVVIAGGLVWYEPEWQAADPAIAFLFAVIVYVPAPSAFMLSCSRFCSHCSGFGSPFAPWGSQRADDGLPAARYILDPDGVHAARRPLEGPPPRSAPRRRRALRLLPTHLAGANPTRKVLRKSTRHRALIQLIRCVGTVHSWRPGRSA